MLDYELKYYSDKVRYIVGCDEAGRGPLAGPVVAAAVIMPADFLCEEVNDSKKLSDKKRRQLAEIIKKQAIAYAICEISSEEIDEINIYQASRKAMEIAIGKLNHPFDLILTDAMPLSITSIPVEAIIKGDAKSFNIACASILAKVYRDNVMELIDLQYPEYGFKFHKGYGTKMHLEALEKYGPIEKLHRFTYAPIKIRTEQIKLF